MSVKVVTTSIGKSTYNLSNTSENTYQADIQAPTVGADYNVTVKATDEAGNVTTVDSTDARFKDILSLKVTETEETRDIRQLILTSELGNIMLDMVAPIYDRSKITLYLFQAMGSIMDQSMDFISGDFISQIFPQTATWGLKYWEDEYGVLTDTSKTIEQRRKYLLSVMYKKYPMTPKRIEDIVSGITGFSCYVIENFEPNTFLVSVNGYYPNVNEIKKELDAKTPAHLNYIVRMAEIENLLIDTSTRGVVSEMEYIKLEVLN